MLLSMFSHRRDPASNGQKHRLQNWGFIFDYFEAMLPGPSERYVPVVESALDEDLDPHPCEEDEEFSKMLMLTLSFMVRDLIAPEVVWC